MTAFQFRVHENGGVCCSSTNSAGEKIPPLHPCDKCRAHFAARGLRTAISQEDTMHDNHHTPTLDAYAADIARLRAAAGQTEYYRALDEQIAAIKAAAAKTTAANEAVRRTLSAVDTSKYAPPDPYAAPLKALREKERR